MGRIREMVMAAVDFMFAAHNGAFMISQVIATISEILRNEKEK